MDNTPELNAALCKAQSEMGPARKGKVNPAFRSNYADLASVIEAVQPLHDHGIAYQQLVSVEGANVSVRTILRHVSGQVLDCGAMVARAKDESAQAIGSALTYLRRYSLQTACGIASADDDGQAAGRPAPTPTPSTWSATEARLFLTALKDLKVSERELATTLATLKRPHPSEMTAQQRAKLLLWLATDDGQNAVAAANHNAPTKE
jgi:hypothetical protein